MSTFDVKVALTYECACVCVCARAHFKNTKMQRQWCSAQHRNRRTRRQTSCAVRGVHSSTFIPSGRPAKRAVKVARCSGDLPKVSCSQNHTCQLTQEKKKYGFECVRDHNNINTPLGDLLKIFYLLVRKQQRAWGGLSGWLLFSTHIKLSDSKISVSDPFSAHVTSSILRPSGKYTSFNCWKKKRMEEGDTKKKIIKKILKKE